MAQSTTSAYAAYQAEKNVTGVGLFLSNDLVEALRAIRPNTKDATIVREAVVTFLNFAYAGEREFELPVKAVKKSKDDQIKELQAQVEALRAQVAPPTPPTQIADAKTGKVTEKVA